MYQVLLFYKYTNVPSPVHVMRAQRKLCEKLNLKGRIIISNEGINGTLEGLKADTEKYISEMEKSEEFNGIVYKRSAGTGSAFPKLRVRARPEIITSGIEGINPSVAAGKYLSAEELYNWFEAKKEFYVVDMRNDFEYASGYFEGFVPSGMQHFFELKDVLPRIEHLKGKTVVTVCTGGVRCEKASAFLLVSGFKDVYQLKDGIQTFMEKYPNKYFKGKLYVFDNRLTLAYNIDARDHLVVGSCFHCSASSDLYVNCEYNECHKHYICCLSCRDKETGFAFCKDECKDKWKLISSMKSLPRNY